MQDGDLPYLDLTSPDFSTRSTEVNVAREANWCARTPFGLAILRHREVGLLLRDRRLRQGSYAWPVTNNLQGSFAEFWQRSIISKEGGAHKALRNLAVPSLSPDYIESLIPAFQASADTLADTLTSTLSCEFMETFSKPFAGQAICTLLGMDIDDWPKISDDASDLGLAMGIKCKSFEPIFNAACDRLTDLADQLIAKARRGEDTTSYIARLTSRFDEIGSIGSLDDQALRDMVVISIFGGVDTTRSQLGFAVSLFISHPDQWQALRTNPALIPNAIEEIIRAWPTTTWATREALDDFEFQGQPIQKGETVHMLVHASARDPQISDGAQFDITKKRKPHFGFGGGAHHCIGHLVARTDMACALKALASRIESFDFDGEAEWLPDSGNTSPVRLPITYTVAAS